MLLVTAADAARLLAPAFAGAAGETLVIAYLDADRRLLHMAVEAGDGVSVKLPLRCIAETALRLGASGLILAHNHPSGDTRPSTADVVATRGLEELANALGLRLHDHLIFAGGACRSLRADGLL